MEYSSTYVYLLVSHHSNENLNCRLQLFLLRIPLIGASRAISHFEADDPSFVDMCGSMDKNHLFKPYQGYYHNPGMKHVFATSFQDKLEL